MWNQEISVKVVTFTWFYLELSLFPVPITLSYAGPFDFSLSIGDWINVLLSAAADFIWNRGYLTKSQLCRFGFEHDVTFVLDDDFRMN